MPDKQKIMTNFKTEIDNWLINSSLANAEPDSTEIWQPVFEPDRHLVYLKIGPYWKLYLRPEGFTKRFYHKIYPLPVESWHISEQTQLYDGFCTFDITLDIRFQATLKYALNNMDKLSGLNEHIKTSYQNLLSNLIQKELLDLSDASWVQKGVTEIEQRISFAVSEILILQNIQSQALCVIKASFAEFPNVQLGQENVFLRVLKRSFEFSQAKREELFRQDREVEQQNQQHKQKQLELLNRDAELDRQIQAQTAGNKKQLLEEQERQLKEQFEIEKQLQLEKIRHENALKEITLDADIQERQKQGARLRIAEQKDQMELLQHQARLKEEKLQADIVGYEKRQAKWLESKNKMFEQQLAIEQRQKQLEFEAHLKSQQRIDEMQKQSYQKRLAADEFLRKELESLALEKQRLELQLTVNEQKKWQDSRNKSGLS